MAEFKTNVPVVQADPVVTVEASEREPFPTGPLRFQLVVVDEAGNESDPAFLDVIVRDSEKPTAVIDVVNGDGKVLEPVVSVGESFILSGARSSDVPPGKVKEYRFTLLDRV